MNGNRLISIVLAMLTAGVLALGWVLGVSPKLAEASTSDTERQLVEAQNAGYQAQLVQLAADFEEIDALRDELTALAVSIPGSHGLEDFLDQLATAAAATGVTLDSVTTSEAAPPTASAETAQTGAGEPGTAPADGTLSIPLTISVSGPMPAVLAFSELLQRSPRLTMISSLSATDEAGTTRGTLIGAIYVLPYED